MMAQVNAGRVRFVGRGEYNNSTQYYVFDLVSYNGNSYYAKADTIGNLPTNTTYWQLVAEKGNVGPTGLTGNGISSITKTGTSVLVDSYTITFTNGNTTTFDVSNGNGIDRIEKTATVGNIDTYTIYFNDNSTSTFEVANGEVTKEELQEEVDRLSMIYNLFPTTSDEDTEMTLDGTGEVKLKKIGLKGNTYQYSTTGKNKINIAGGDKSGSTTLNGLTFKINNDGSITISGTSNNSFSFPIDYTTVMPLTLGTNYFYSIKDSQGNDLPTSLFQVEWLGINNNKKYNYGSVNNIDGIKRVRIYGDSGKTINETYYFQIEEGISYTNWEEYTGSNPSPSPDYPQDIHVVSGDNEVKVEGKNLCNGINQNVYLNNATNQCGIASNNSGLYIQVNGGNYTISTTATQERYRVACSNNEPSTAAQTSYIGKNKDNTSNSITIDTTGYSYLVVNATDLTKIQIEKGNSASEFQPYQSQSYAVNLGDIELCKIGDYQDKIYKENGNWYKHSEIGKVVLDGTNIKVSKVNVIGNSKNGFGFDFDNSLRTTGGINLNYYCDKLLSKTRTEVYTNSNQGICPPATNDYYGTGCFLYIEECGDYTKEQMGTYLSSKPITLYFPLATPTITEITDTTLIEQLDNLENAYSYDTQTNITQTNDDMPFILDVEALMSLKGVLN